MLILIKRHAESGHSRVGSVAIVTPDQPTLPFGTFERSGCATITRLTSEAQILILFLPFTKDIVARSTRSRSLHLLFLLGFQSPALLSFDSRRGS
jgi:hypothetical protein